MTKPLKITLGILGSSIIILIAFIFFLKYLVTKSFPEYEGKINVKGIKGEVTIFRDEFGVPHIFAGEEYDLMFAAGYVQAQDRLWQMDISRRAGEGRLAEVLGNSATGFDRLFRTLNLTEIISKIETELPPEVGSALKAYSDGVNAFILENQSNFPIEFDILGYEPELWKVEHSLLLSRLMAWDLNLAWWLDLTMGELTDKFGYEKAKELLPVYPATAPTIVKGKLQDRKVLRNTSRNQFDIPNISGFKQLVQQYRNYFGINGSATGSNGWVISAAKSTSGKPILANDPHLGLPAPSKWYEMHLSIHGWNVAGCAIPGTPFIVIGSNNRIAWGLTNAMIDETDFYIVTTDSANPNLYNYEKKLIPIKSREEVIYIGKDDSLEFTIRETHHGPIISDLHPALLTKADPQNKLVAMRWCGFEVSQESYAFYLINKASNKEEFENALKHFAVPGQNVIYSDVEGNIGYWTAAKIPLRGNFNPTFPLPGWSKEYEWKGFVSFDQLPKLWNPPEQFIATANNKIADNTPYFISNLYMPPSRIERINDLLSEVNLFSAEDFKRMQLDYISPHTRKLTKLITDSFKEHPATDSDTKSALEYLSNWDFKHSPTDVASTIFNMFFVKLIHNIFEDEMGKEILNDYTFFSAVPIIVVDKLLTADTSSWFDNVNTEAIETKSDIIKKSLSDALEQLRIDIDPELKNWQWGVLHPVTFEHLFGTRKPLDKVFNIGPFPVGGSATTINNGEFNFNRSFKNVVGPSTRQIVDLAKPLSRFSVLTTGQSGQPLHKHYSDQTLLWLNGDYKYVSMDRNEIENSGWKKLELAPQK